MTSLPDFSTYKVEGLQGLCRGLGLRVSGDRATLLARLGTARELRERYAGLTEAEVLAATTVPVLKAELRRIDWSRWGKKGVLARRLLRFANQPAVAVGPRRLPSWIVTWTHPLTGKRVRYMPGVFSRVSAEDFAAKARLRWTNLLMSARHHVSDLHEPAIRAEPSADVEDAPEALDEATAFLVEIGNLEQDAMGPALLGDLAKLRQIQRKIEAAKVELNKGWRRT